MKRVHSLTAFVTILLLLLCLSGCFSSATLQVEKEIPAAPTRPISFTLVTTPDVPLSAEELNALRARLVDSLAWEGGLRVGQNDSFKVIGTVRQYEPGFRLLRPFAPGLFVSTWVVVDEHDKEIGRAHISGRVYTGTVGGSFDKVLEKVGERLSEFLTKQPESLLPKK